MCGAWVLITLLDDVFSSIDQEASGERCDAIDGLIKETQGVMEVATGQAAKHAAILGCCQAIEHDEIACYGTLRE